MEDLEHLLLNYDDLPAAERAQADAYLDAHPGAASVLAEGRALRGLLEQAARAGADLPDAESIAHYVAARHMAHHPLPSDLAALEQRIEAALAAHPDVERQFSMMQDRLRTLTAEAESPRAQFERLTGRRLGGAQPKETASPLPFAPLPEPPVEHRNPSERRARSGGWRTSVADYAAIPFLQRVSLPRLAFAASFVLVLVYGSLFVASRAGQPRTVRLADLGAVESEFAGLRLRGADGVMDPAADRYAAALETLHDARTSVLGLFPSYDAEGLGDTVHLLEETITLGGEDSALGLEAWFLIGKILLYEGETDAARDAFRIVVDRQGPSAPDAQRFLDQL
ncbi:MAG: hypothetical protein ABJF88_09760 [Rhodothermales bacterium]